MEHEGLRQAELTCDPWPEQRADETERDGCHEAYLAAAREGLADGAANRRDHDQHDEPRQCQSHETPLCDALLTSPKQPAAESGRRPATSRDRTGGDERHRLVDCV